jgi:hypothetical protein
LANTVPSAFPQDPIYECHGFNTPAPRSLARSGVFLEND